MPARPTTWAVLNAAGLLLALVANGLAAGLPLNGMDTGALSDLYPNLFVPAGITFSIWGVIYLWLIAFVVFGLSRVRSPQGQGHLEAIGPWFLINCLANTAWIFAWHWTLVGLSVGLMLLILASLIVMYLRLGTGRQPTSTAEQWLVRAPISIYLGWITVATIANITALAVDLGAPAFGQTPAALTVAVLAVAVLLTTAMLWTRRDVAYSLVVIWAFFGIYMKRSDATEEGSALVATAALAGLVALAGAVVAALAIEARDARTRAGS